MGRPGEDDEEDDQAAELAIESSIAAQEAAALLEATNAPTVPAPDEVAQLAKDAARLYSEIKDDDARLKRKKAALDLMEFRLRERMERGELKQVVTVDAAGRRTTLYLKACTYVGLLKQDREALKEWLKANGQGEIVKEEVNAKTLAAHVSELLKEGGEVPPMVKVTHANEVRYNRG